MKKSDIHVYPDGEPGTPEYEPGKIIRSPRMTPTNDAPVTVERYTVSKQADNSVASRWCIRDGAEGGRYVAGGITGRASASVIAHEMNRLAALASAPAGDGGEALSPAWRSAYAMLVPFCCGSDDTGRKTVLPLNDAIDVLAAALARPRAAVDTVDCDRCCGNGEIVTDWDRYKHAHEGDKGDEAVADCPDCGGTGKVDSPRAAVGERRWFPHNDFVGEPMQEGQFREPYPMAEEREAIARIIAPDKWQEREGYIRRQMAHWQYNADAVVRASLEKADAILALQSPPAKVEG